MAFIVCFLTKFITQVKFSLERLDKNTLENIHLENKTWHLSNINNKRLVDRDIDPGRKGKIVEFYYFKTGSIIVFK